MTATRLLASHFTPGEEREKFMEVRRSYNRDRFEVGPAALEKLIADYGIAPTYAIAATVHSPQEAYTLVVNALGNTAHRLDDSSAFIESVAHQLEQGISTVKAVLSANERTASIAIPGDVNPHKDISAAEHTVGIPCPVLSSVTTVQQAMGQVARTQGWNL